MNDLACPICHNQEFGTSGRLTFASGFTIEEDGDLYHHDDEILWETIEVNWLECYSCGWGVEVNTNEPFRVSDYLSPILDRDVEDLPDEEHVDTEVPDEDKQEEEPDEDL